MAETRQRWRLSRGGAIDRGSPIRFTFDGHAYEGYEGDTLASALFANDVFVLGRSWKYHRPRGVMASGVAEPNALVTLLDGDQSVPNLQATMVPLTEGLVAISQNRWPGVRHDWLAGFDLLSRFLPPGFYYKTFNWPRRLWPLYEGVLRRLAGLGQAPRHPQGSSYDQLYAHADILVVGAGVAGLAAARAAASGGARVLLVGQSTIDAPVSAGGPAILKRATMVGCYGSYAAVYEQHPRDDRLGRGGRLHRIRFGQLILATGAIERPLLFDNNDRPGILLASAILQLLQCFAVMPGRRLVVATNNDHAYTTAFAAQEAGCEIAAIVDLRRGGSVALRQAAARRGIRVVAGRTILSAEGKEHVRAVMVAATEGRGASETIACDLVAMSGGWNPSLQLATQAGAILRYDAAREAFVVAGLPEYVQVAGAASGIYDAGEAVRDAEAKGQRAAENSGRSPSLRPTPATTITHGPCNAIAPAMVRRESGRSQKAFIDFQNDVSARDLVIALQEGYVSVEHTKRYTTLGMGLDQGKTSTVHAVQLLGALRARSPGEIGTPRPRPPFVPVPLAAYAGFRQGALLQPFRRTALDGWHKARGALFENAGLWRRPIAYPRPGETLPEAERREARAVRSAVGLFDVSPFGKIEIHGRDSLAFLNRIYANDLSKLAIGRSVYSMMLTEHGRIFDDGIVSRLGDDHYLLSPTSAMADRVPQWLDLWAQTVWPELEVRISTVSDQWAQVALQGPLAREVLRRAGTDVSLEQADFPMMSMRQGLVARLPARLSRASFTGELGFEIAVPASLAPSLCDALMDAGAGHGITPYGLMASNILRLEKGFLIHGAELDGNQTLDDVGLGWMVRKRKTENFIGCRALSLPDLIRKDRRQLVGLLSEPGDEALPLGGLVSRGAEPGPEHPWIGRVVSSGFSVALDHGIALAFVESGRALKGQKIQIFANGKSQVATVSDPVFYDVARERING